MGAIITFIFFVVVFAISGGFSIDNSNYYESGQNRGRSLGRKTSRWN